MSNSISKLKEKTKTLTPGIIITGFVFIVIFCLGGIFAPLIDVLYGKEDFDYSLGTNILGVFVCSVLYFGCMRDNRNSTRPFLLMIFIVASSFFGGIVVDNALVSSGNGFSADYINMFVVAYMNIMELVLAYCFWRYVRNTLDFKGPLARVGDIIAKIFMVPSILYIIITSLLNFFEIIVGSTQAIDNNEELVPDMYFWDFFDYSDLYIFYIYILTAICLIKYKAAIKYKIAVIVFMVIPLLHYIVPIFFPMVLSDITSQNSSRLVAILVMYVFLFTEQSDKLNLKEQELDTATELQRAMLPSNFPYFTKRNEFSVYASMDPAREVGGDFYDFYMLDDDHLALVIGDVSGKGVPAALFMVSSRMIISNYTKSSKSPARILELANNEIYENNEHMLFISVWLGILEISTGVMTCANAGHEYPEVYIAPEEFKLYKDTHGIVLGAMPDAKFQDYALQLTPGSKVFVYTDGIAEATNIKNELFGTERLTSILNSEKNESNEEVLKSIKTEVDSFAKGVEQFDDITMLCVTYNGVKDVAKKKEITINAEVELLNEVKKFVGSHVEDIDCSEKTLIELDVIVEEIFVNIASYAYAPFTGKVTISVEVDDNNEYITMKFTDKGRQYNPLDKEDPDITASSEEREIGGLGIFMTKQFADDVEYEFKDMKNNLIIKKLLNG